MLECFWLSVAGSLHSWKLPLCIAMRLCTTLDLFRCLSEKVSLYSWGLPLLHRVISGFTPSGLHTRCFSLLPEPVFLAIYIGIQPFAPWLLMVFIPCLHCYVRLEIVKSRIYRLKLDSRRALKERPLLDPPAMFTSFCRVLYWPSLAYGYRRARRFRSFLSHLAPTLRPDENA